MNPVEALGGEAGLVALKRPDEMPLERWKLAHLFERFLHIVLAECALTRCERFANAPDAMAFGDCQQSHLLRRAASALDARSHSLQVF
jgi:hypothetical protein